VQGVDGKGWIGGLIQQTRLYPADFTGPGKKDQDVTSILPFCQRLMNGVGDGIFPSRSAMNAKARERERTLSINGLHGKASSLTPEDRGGRTEKSRHGFGIQGRRENTEP
jgi:hypothetical protein